MKKLPILIGVVVVAVFVLVNSIFIVDERQQALRIIASTTSQTNFCLVRVAVKAVGSPSELVVTIHLVPSGSSSLFLV